MTKNVALTLLALVTCATAAEFGIGRCPYIRPQADLDANGLLGHWYEYARYPIAAQSYARCNTADYGLHPEGNYSITHTYLNSYTGLQTRFNGRAALIGPGKFQIKFDGVAGLLGNGDYYILGSDYGNFTVGYQCENQWGFFHSDYAWLLTRLPQPNQDTVSAARNVLLQNGLSVRELVPTDQFNCPANH